jgi:phosphatidylglycerol:prolipoprotein diacylglycerol transferase
MGDRLRCSAPLLALAVALAAVGAFVALAAAHGGVPFVTLSRIDVGIPFEPFGSIVAGGVVVGAIVLRRYAARHGIADGDARDLVLWIVLTGAIGAHVFEVLMYQPHLLRSDPLVLLRLWQGISSYGGFVGGALGYVAFVRRRRLPPAVVADTVMLGLLVAFSIGRIACSIIHDHVGHATDFWLATDYPQAELAERHLLSAFPDAGDVVRAHNLGLYELLFLIPLNALALGLAFRREPSLPAGWLSVLIALVYIPLRFALEPLRLDVSDPRWAGLTFAQWASIGGFAVALGAAIVLARRDAAAPPPGGAADRDPARRGKRRRR